MIYDHPSTQQHLTPQLAGLALVADVSYGALLEVGRSDLALLVQWFIDDDGSFYVEPMEELTGDDLALIERAERLALSAVQRSDLEVSAPRGSGGESSPATSQPIRFAGGRPGEPLPKPDCDALSRHTDADDERNIR